MNVFQENTFNTQPQQPPFQSDQEQSQQPPFQSEQQQSQQPPFQSEQQQSQQPPFQSDQQQSQRPPFQSDQQQSQQSQQSQFKPSLKNNQQVIVSFSPGKFEALTKLLSVLDDESIIVIKDSIIKQAVNNGTGILDTNISELANNSLINFHILQPKKFIKMFKQLKGNNDVYLIDDPNNSRYIIDNGFAKIPLPKQIEEFDKDTDLPNLDNVQPVGNSVSLNKKNIGSYKSIVSGSESVNINLLLKDNQAKGIHVPDTGIIVRFPEYLSEDISLDNSQMLTTYTFLAISGEVVEIYLGQNTSDNSYWLLQRINTGFVYVRITEKLQEVEEDTLLL